MKQENWAVIGSCSLLDYLCTRGDNRKILHINPLRFSWFLTDYYDWVFFFAFWLSIFETACKFDLKKFLISIATKSPHGQCWTWLVFTSATTPYGLWVHLAYLSNHQIWEQARLTSLTISCCKPCIVCSTLVRFNICLFWVSVSPLSLYVSWKTGSACKTFEGKTSKSLKQNAKKSFIRAIKTS